MSTIPRVPPAYKNVVIKGKTGKVFATGIDKKGRKQIIYNKWFVKQQQNIRFKKIMALKSVFNKIVTNIDAYLSKPTIMLFKTPESVKKLELSIIIKLMILCNFRIGSRKYLKLYNTYGITTIIWKFVTFSVNKKTFNIKFVGKKSVVNAAVCNDRKLYKLLWTLKNYNKSGNESSVFNVTAKEVNSYIASYHADLTAKDIRTWRANVLFIKFFNETPKQLKRSKKILFALKNVATLLHNTVAVCKSNYVHPSLIK